MYLFTSAGPVSMLVGNIGTRPVALAEAPSEVAMATSETDSTTATLLEQSVVKEETNKVARKVVSVDIQKAVRNYFSDVPVLAEIARCESTYRHFNSNGEVLRGNVNSKDVGVMQINERFHSSRAQSLGIDLHSLEGNMKYARTLYREQGVAPWKSSAPCWGSKVAANPVPALASQ